MTLRRLLLFLPCTVLLSSGHGRADSVPVGESSLIGALDFSDSFTLGTGSRTNLAPGAYPVGNTAPEALAVENFHANTETFWSDQKWSLSDDANVNNGTPPYPGGSGGGSAAGMTQTGNAIDYGLEYDLRDDFVVQFDAVQPLDRANLTIGNMRDGIAGDLNPDGLSVFIRADGQASEVGLYNALLGEIDTGLDTGLAAVKTGQWHNYAARFNLAAKTITVYVDEVSLGTVDLATLGSETIPAGAFADLITDASNDAVSVGGSGGTRLWTDNFQVGAFGVPAVAGIRLGTPVAVRDTKNTPDPADDTFSVRVRVTGRGPVSTDGWVVTPPAGSSGAPIGAYGAVAVFTGIPVSVPEVTLKFTDEEEPDLSASVTIPTPPVPLPVTSGVAVGSSRLISTLDYSDTFTIGDGAEGTRQGTAYTTGAYPIPAGSPLLNVETAYDHPAQSWTTALWSLNNNAVIADGDPPWPGDSGTGSATGITQTGNGVDYGIEYGLRRDFVVQIDAVQTPDRVNLTMGNVRDSIAGPANPNGISVFIRADGQTALPEVGIYNSSVGEVDAGLDTGRAGLAVGEWHNYAVRFNNLDKTLTVFADEISLGTVDLATFHDGAFASLLSEDSYKAVSVGAAGGNRVWTDNFQIGAPVGVPVGGSTLIGTLDYSDTFTIGVGNMDNARNSVPYPIGAYPLEDEAQLTVENSHGNPPRLWSTRAWSLNNDSTIADGEPAWPGGSGSGSVTGITQTGGGVDYGIEYDLREDFVVQFDAVQNTDRINITSGNVRDNIAGAANPNGISVFFRLDGHATLPEVGVYNEALGEVSAELDTGLAHVGLGEWHNYAVRFNFPALKLEMYVDGVHLGTVDLTTFGGPTAQNGGNVEPGAFAALVSEQSNDAVSVGGSGGNRVWTDNFQIGAPTGAVTPSGDTDGDGMSDAQELIAGTNPADPASVLRITGLAPAAAGGGVWEARFPSVAGRFYRLYSSPDLKVWTRVDALATIVGTGAEAVATVIPAAEAARRFLRIHAAASDNFPAVMP